MFREGTKMAGGERGRTSPGAEPATLSSGPSDAPGTPVMPVTSAGTIGGSALATATAAGVLGLAAAVVSVLTLQSDGEGLHAGIVALLYVPSALIGVASVVLHRRQAARHAALLHAEIARHARAEERLGDELESRRAEIAELLRSRQLLLAEDNLLRERMQESFVNLAMRSLTLVERQLDLLEKLEHGEEDARRLDALFRLDHLATRMRRNGENVLILADADERHGHRPSATLLDVVRAAVSEIEYYERVDIGHIPRAELAGHTAEDISHLVAELLENAAAYSPPGTRVTVAGRTLENRGVLLTIEDEGFGVPPDRLPELNAQLQGGRGAASSSDLGGLGVFVVGALAVRHGLRVQLRPRREGGLTAIVMLPAALLGGSAPSPIPAAAGIAGRGGRLTGGTRSTLAERHEAVRARETSSAVGADAAAGSPPAPRPPVTAQPPAPAIPAESVVTAPSHADPTTPTAAPGAPTPLPKRVPKRQAAPGTPAAQPAQAARTATGLPKRVPRTPPAERDGNSAPDTNSSGSGPIAAEELRRRLSGFQMGSTAARRAAPEEGAADGALPPPVFGPDDTRPADSSSSTRSRSAAPASGGDHR
jgi:signal transduction histidine kinase